VDIRPVPVNGSAGVVVSLNSEPVSVMGFTISDGKIVEIDSLADPARAERVARAYGAPEPGEDSP
jgi:RNA polymerase sigma-70 factor, ECF subfamily